MLNICYKNLLSRRLMAGFSSEVADYKSRYAWKYAASRGITGTPQFIVNGVSAPDVSGYSKQQVEELIDKLLNAPY